MPGTQKSLRILSCLAACMLVIVDADAAPADARNANIARLLDEANHRTASGEPADVVEQWLTQAMQSDGMTTTPPAWDVYGRTRWQAMQDANDTTATPAPIFVVSTDSGRGNPPSLVSAPAVITTNP
ncbi:MAG TPA: hypothetical protein VGO76_02185 [Luteibacter sp.]|jgi:hypothetical protein|nr:hypothetical protein [Luteibacter sp.]